SFQLTEGACAAQRSSQAWFVRSAASSRSPGNAGAGMAGDAAGASSQRGQAATLSAAAACGSVTIKASAQIALRDPAKAIFPRLIVPSSLISAAFACSTDAI